MKEGTVEPERKLIAVLESDAPLEGRQEACRQLWRTGTDASVPALEKMLASGDVRVVEAACYALSRRRSEAVSRALRRALNRVHPAALEPVVNLIGDRREAWAASRLAQMETDAAIAALGKIATPESVRALMASRRPAAEHALLQAAQELTRRGQPAAAKDIYARLAGSRTPQIARGARIALEKLL